MPTGEHPWLSASPDNGNPLRCTIEVMFCPECLTEYRAGFTRCSDCDMELVHEIPDRKPVRKSKRDSATNFLTGSSPKFFATFISLGWIPAGLLGLMVAEKHGTGPRTELFRSEHRFQHIRAARLVILKHESVRLAGTAAAFTFHHL